MEHRFLRIDGGNQARCAQARQGHDKLHFYCNCSCCRPSGLRFVFVFAHNRVHDPEEKNAAHLLRAGRPKLGTRSGKIRLALDLRRSADLHGLRNAGRARVLDPGDQSGLLCGSGQKRYQRTIALGATRGRIVDRNGSMLGVSLETCEIWATPKLLDEVAHVPLATLLDMPLTDTAHVPSAEPAANTAKTATSTACTVTTPATAGAIRTMLERAT